MMFNQTCTLYRKQKIGGAISWTRRVIQGVFWDERSSQSYRKLGANKHADLQVIIPEVIPVEAGDILVYGERTEGIQSSSRELNGVPRVFTVVTVDAKDFQSDMKHLEIAGIRHE